MHHELAARGFKHGASGNKAVAAAVSQSPLDAVTAQKMRVALGELGRGENFARGRDWLIGGEHAGHPSTLVPSACRAPTRRARYIPS